MLSYEQRMDIEQPKLKETKMKAFIIVLGIVCLLLTIAISAIRGSSPEEQNKKETLTQDEKLDVLTVLTDMVVNNITENSKVAKAEMKELRKIVDQYKDEPLYKQLKKEFDPAAIPQLYLLATVERITGLYFPSLGHSCEKECVNQVRFLFNTLGADVKEVEPNTGPRDVLIYAAAALAAVIFFFFWIFRRVCFLGELKERTDKKKTPP